MKRHLPKWWNEDTGRTGAPALRILAYSLMTVLVVSVGARVVTSLN